MQKDIDWGAAAFGIVALFLTTVFVKGWALSAMWSWFLVPLGIPAINLYVGGGICFMISLVRPGGERQEMNWDNMAKSIFCDVLYPLTILGFGYLVTVIM